MKNLEKLLEGLEVTEEQRIYIAKELQDIEIREDEGINIKDTGMQGGSDQEEIYEVVLTNGDTERHLCYI